MSKQNEATLPKIVAIDFDGTLVEDRFPDIGAPIKSMFSLVKALQASNIRVILWTCRDGQNLANAVAYCKSYGVTFDAVNTNIPEVINMYNNDTRKVFADLYIDDKSIPHVQDPLYWIDRLGLKYPDFVSVLYSQK